MCLYLFIINYHHDIDRRRIFFCMTYVRTYIILYVPNVTDRNLDTWFYILYYFMIQSNSSTCIRYATKQTRKTFNYDPKYDILKKH